MPSEIKREVRLEIVHVLFLDIVGYSTRLTDEQQALIDQLNEVVRASNEFQKAQTADRLITIPTGDGMALIFYNSPEQPVQCALEIARSANGNLPMRMGIHSGPVSAVTDLNDRVNAAGVGINVAQRVMDCGDAGHILLSKRVAEDLQQYGRWRALLHDLGEVEVKHGVRVHVFNFYTDDAGNPNWPETVRKVKADQPRAPTTVAPEKVQATGARPSICVLPFANMSGDAEQEYFSDGISEDIITDLSKVSALHVISRNTAFTFKGKPVDLRQVANQLKVTHVLEGSVRKAAGRVRVTAQLIDGSNDSHVWAERYDRDLHDIFALQDEISHAIVDALKVKLLPEEKKAIEKHGTTSVEAYNLYLMARQAYATGFEGDNRRNEVIIRLCRRATEIDPNYADAWALLALAEMLLGSIGAQQNTEMGLAAAERALALNPDSAEAHAVKARLLSEANRHDEASNEIEAALRLNPESHEVNKCAAVLRFRQQRLKEAARYFEKAVALEEMDFASAGMLITCYTAQEKHEEARRAAEIALARAEKVLAQDPNNGSAMGHGSDALAVLGRAERAKEWMNRALLFDPDNLAMRYNFACALATHLKDNEAALDMLAPAFEKMNAGLINHSKVDPDFDPLRQHPRFQAMLAAAEKRVGLTS